jgi:uncharacterized protein (TIGR00251 family)
MVLRVKVSPNARRSEILGWEEHPTAGWHLRIRLQAPPIDGKANQALVRFLATELGVPKSKITLKQGLASRLKTLHLPDGTPLPPMDQSH